MKNKGGANGHLLFNNTCQFFTMNSSLRREIIGEENYILQHCVRCLLHFTLYSSVALDTALDSALNCYQYSIASTFYTGEAYILSNLACILC